MLLISLYGPSMFAVKAQIQAQTIIIPDLSLLMKHLVIGQRQKAVNFSAIHWSPHDSLVSIGQHFITTRVVHLPKRTESSLITESDQSGHNHRIGQLLVYHLFAIKLSKHDIFRTPPYVGPPGNAHLSCFIPDTIIIYANCFHVISVIVYEVTE